MKNLHNFERFEFLKENYGNDFVSYNVSPNQGSTSGPTNQLGYVQDPNLSIMSDGSSIYIDNYQRMSMYANDLFKIMSGMYGTMKQMYQSNTTDTFLEDIDNLANLKILRICKNESQNLDVYISFDFGEDEYFGVYKNFNCFQKPKLTSEFISDPRNTFINKEYYLKFSNYLYRILLKWFAPEVGVYKNLNPDMKIRNNMGEMIPLKINTTVEVKGYNIDKDGRYYIVVKYKDERYVINGDNYYFFKYYFDKI